MMQYYKPEGDFFVGDCMPFTHDGVFHLFYLLDENHHQWRGGLGGHQWAHASTHDLVHWEHHPLALPIDEDWEGSICTGSVFHHQGLYHAFYATRMPDFTQHLSHAISQDGIAFEKLEPNPFLSPPPGYNPYDFRDPFVFRDPGGRFQMLVTAKILDYPLFDRGGCLLRLSSADLFAWEVEGPFLTPGGLPGYAHVPECPDAFAWNGWYYVLYGMGGQTRYRMSRSQYGPWRAPANDLLDCPTLTVIKTAPYGDGRRLAAGWLGSRKDNRDDGARMFGGNAVLRELVQNADGSLSTRFVPEMALHAPKACHIDFQPLTQGASGDPSWIALEGTGNPTAAALTGAPTDYWLRCRVLPREVNGRFGIGLRGAGRMQSAYLLDFDPGLRKVSLAGEAIEGVDGLERPFEVEIVASGEILDVCIGKRRCLTERVYELRGNSIFFYSQGGTVTFDEINLEEALPAG